GLCPEAGSSLLLPMLSGYHHAAQAILLGQPFTAAQAKEWGIVNQICPAGEADVAALAAARQLVAQPPASMRISRDLLRTPFREQVKDAIRRENAAFKERLMSPEAAEAFQAFVQRRPPDFSSFS
ncbi:MAG: enoyl-CoA hydratase-related protein, partial [Candidatus Hydrogenedentes bacterium]|nr:enoyl-CoA hydratase-related protein [Candidatus Hydrogenedentota bacterium]